MTNSTLPYGHRPPEQRVGQSCDACGQVDDHPRVHIGLDDGRIVSYHFDCAAAMGNEHAAEVMAASGNAQGEKLLAHITGRAKG